MTKISQKLSDMIEKACSEWDKPWSKMPDDEKEMAREDYIKICYAFLSEKVAEELGLKWKNQRLEGLRDDKTRN